MSDAGAGRGRTRTRFGLLPLWCRLDDALFIPAAGRRAGAGSLVFPATAQPDGRIVLVEGAR